MVAFAGVTAIETRVGAVTVSTAEPLTLPELAPMVAVPAALLVASPALEIVAMPVADDCQVAEFVRSLVDESLYVPVAVNCCVSPAATDGFAGVTAIDCRVGVLGVLLLELQATRKLSMTRAMRRGRNFTTCLTASQKIGDGKWLGFCVGECTGEPAAEQEKQLPPRWRRLNSGNLQPNRLPARGLLALEVQRARPCGNWAIFLAR
jgi:hypothetical protein